VARGRAQDVAQLAHDMGTELLGTQGWRAAMEGSALRDGVVNVGRPSTPQVAGCSSAGRALTPRGAGSAIAAILPIDRRVGRAVIGSLFAVMPDGKVDGVAIEKPPGDGPGVRVYRPSVIWSPAALMWIHGGGFVIGRAVQNDRFCGATARELGMVVVSVEYRKAPKHPFPAALDDCAAGWAWMQGEAAALGIDAARVALGGESAGGGLAASLAQRLHDEAGTRPAAQWLFCPMLDDRTAARQELDTVDHFVWNNRLNRFGWRSYLRGEPGAASLPAYAAAARRADLAGLPPAWIGVGDIDLFCEEDLAYAERLRSAGVEAALDVVPGAPHGFEVWAPDTALARGHVGRAQDWLRDAVGVDGRPER
jgi:acetyl esterase/lipase